MSKITIEDTRPKVENYDNASCWQKMNDLDLNECFGKSFMRLSSHFDALENLANQCSYSDFNFTRARQVEEFFEYPHEKFWDIDNLLSYIRYRVDLMKFELDCLDGSEEIK